MKTAAAVIVLIGCFLVPPVAWPLPASSPHRDGRMAAVKAFLRAYFGREPGDDSAEPGVGLRYSAVFVDLNAGPERQVIVYVTGRSICGSGGCSLLVLSKTNGEYKRIARTTITRPPIRVLDTWSHGFRDLGVWVEGGGVLPGYEARLRFNGKTYASNPSVAPAQRIPVATPGRIVISGHESSQLVF